MIAMKNEDVIGPDEISVESKKLQMIRILAH